MRAPQTTAAALIPPDASLTELARIAADCTACDLHLTGTQTVFGEGAAAATLVLVGEQPGDREDQEGRPFVGPAGQELDRALTAVGLGDVAQYRTNAVKHFKWSERRGKRRIHEKPSAIEIRACLPWLQAELAQTHPKALVLLGATAAQAVLGPKTKVTQARGRLHLGPGGLPTVPTVHPSSVLRARSDAERLAAREAFQDDLAAVATLVATGPSGLAASATVAELRELVRELGRQVPSRARKADLVAEVAGAFRAGG
ncbi:UdgX family uracil-DNA binding protein [Egicoccus sp. AB-alg6-2]|uniref:UdgX family uracil-DNA binding protein n=1 Tax=Egicoccus sp. AB-alg6-2 TaxID=3242692 RepID=UPI00359DDFF8